MRRLPLWGAIKMVDPCLAALPAAEDFAVGDQEPAVLVGGPGAPAVCDPLQVVGCRVAALRGGGRERRLDRALGPQAAPPGPVGLCGVGPVGRRAGDVGEARLPGPDVQAAPAVRLAAVAARDRDVELPPLVKDGGLGAPGHAAE